MTDVLPEAMEHRYEVTSNVSRSHFLAWLYGMRRSGLSATMKAYDPSFMGLSTGWQSRRWIETTGGLMPTEKERQEPESQPSSPIPSNDDHDLETGEGGAFEMPEKPIDD